MEETCAHLKIAELPTPDSERGCEECIAIDSRWVHLRMCLTCGHVGCCDQSPNRHARGHFKSSGHEAISSREPGEEWGYCFADDTYVDQLIQ